MDNHLLSGRIQLSVIIPAYNEEKRLPGYLATLLPYLSEHWHGFEVIVVDDGSTDGTCTVVNSFRSSYSQLSLLSLPCNQGKGNAVRSGMLAAAGQLRLFADADGATPITELDRLVKALEGGFDIAVASRALQSDDCIVCSTVHRKIIGTIFNSIVRLIAVHGVRDTQCGFKLFSAHAAEMIFPRQTIDGFGFDLELLFIAQRKYLKIAEVPVNWVDVPGTKVNILRDSVRMFADVLNVRLCQLRGFYD